MNREFYYYVLLSIFLFIPIVGAQENQSEKWKLCRYYLKKYQRSNLSGNTFYPGDQTIDINYYKIDLTITNSPDYIKGSLTILARVDTAIINSLFLDCAQNMIVDSIIIQDTTLAQFFRLHTSASGGLNHLKKQLTKKSVLRSYQSLTQLNFPQKICTTIK